jgi:hypothetical protein
MNGILEHEAARQRTNTALALAKCFDIVSLDKGRQCRLTKTSMPSSSSTVVTKMKDDRPETRIAMRGMISSP